MLKNKALLVQMVPSDAASMFTNEEPSEYLNPDWINNTIKDQVSHLALVIVSVMIVGRILDTTAAVIVRRTPSKR